MSAIAEFDGAREKRTDFCLYYPQNYVPNIRAKLATFCG